MVLPDGQKFGPADVQLLNQWVAEGRVLPTTMLEDSMSGRQIPATHVPGIQMLAQQPPQGHFPPPGQAPGQPYAGYYRGGMVDNGHNDLTLSYVFGALGIVVCFFCGIFGAVLPILGLVFAQRAQKKGNPGSSGARVLSWIGVALYVVVLILFVFAFGVGAM